MTIQHAYMYSAIMCNLHKCLQQQGLTILSRLEKRSFFFFFFLTKFIATWPSSLLVRPPCCLLARVLLRRKRHNTLKKLPPFQLFYQEVSLGHPKI